MLVNPLSSTKFKLKIMCQQLVPSYNLFKLNALCCHSTFTDLIGTNMLTHIPDVKGHKIAILIGVHGCGKLLEEIVL